MWKHKKYCKYRDHFFFIPVYYLPLQIKGWYNICIFHVGIFFWEMHVVPVAFYAFPHIPTNLPQSKATFVCCMLHTMATHKLKTKAWERICEINRWLLFVYPPIIDFYALKWLFAHIDTINSLHPNITIFLQYIFCNAFCCTDFSKLFIFRG